MKIFNSQMIQDFAQAMQPEHYQQAFDWIEATFTQVIEQLRKNNPIITSDYELVLVGDFLTSTYTQNSEIDLFIAIKSPQLELNSIKFSQDKFKQFWLKLKKAYNLTRQEKKRKKKRKKQQEEKISEIPVNKYNMLDFKNQTVQYLAYLLTADSSIFINNNGFKVVSRNQLGIDINVFPAIKSEGDYKVFNEEKGKFVTYNFEELEHNLNKKQQEVGEIYFDIVRVFKNLYYNINSSTLPNAYLIESLIFNCPNTLFAGDSFYQIFLKILNYLHNVNIADFVFILNTKQKLFTTDLINQSIANVMSFIRKIDMLIKH